MEDHSLKTLEVSHCGACKWSEGGACRWFFLLFLLLSYFGNEIVANKLWCFGGCCSVNVWTLVYGVHFHLQHQQFPANALPMLFALLLTLYFGLTNCVGVSQWWPSPTFVYIEYKSGMGVCLVRVPRSCNPQSHYWNVTHVAQG